MEVVSAGSRRCPGLAYIGWLDFKANLKAVQCDAFQLIYAGKNAPHINAHRRLEQVAKVISVNAS